MTEGNRQRLQEAIEMIAVLVDNRGKRFDTQRVTLSVLDVQNKLNVVLQDLVFRPEVNEGTRT